MIIAKRIVRLVMFGPMVCIVAGMAWLFNDHEVACDILHELWYGTEI